MDNILFLIHQNLDPGWLMGSGLCVLTLALQLFCQPVESKPKQTMETDEMGGIQWKAVEKP